MNNVVTNASRPTLLFLPGTLCDSRVWQAVANKLSDSGWTCIHVDYRDQDRIANMANVALSTAHGRIIPIGLSMGGMVALEMWRQAPERVAAIALFDTTADSDTADRQSRRDAQLAYAKQNGLSALAQSTLAPSYNGQHPKLADTVIAMAESQSIENFEAQCAALATRQDAWPLLPTINVPTLIACGEHDVICTPDRHQRMAEMIANSTLTIIPNAGHLAPIDAPATLSELLHIWLDKNVVRSDAKVAD